MTRTKQVRTESISPFQRLQPMLAELIASIPAGERLPSEPELAKKMGVSRATLREAMRDFEGQGVIRRKQGVGTFVVNPSQVIQSGLEVLESIETLAKRIQLDVSMGDLDIQHIQADSVQAEALKVALGDPLVRVNRVIRTKDRPVAFLVDVLPEDVLSEAELEMGFTGSVLDLLLRRGTPMLSTSMTEISAAAASPEIARSLEIQRGDVLLFISACLYTIEQRVIDYSQSYFLPGYFKFFVVRRVGMSILPPV